jgi:hypothetical protein
MTSDVLMNDLSGLGPGGPESRVPGSWLLDHRQVPDSRGLARSRDARSEGIVAPSARECQEKNHQMLRVCDPRPLQVVGNRFEKLWKNGPRSRGKPVEISVG